MFQTSEAYITPGGWTEISTVMYLQDSHPVSTKMNDRFLNFYTFTPFLQYVQSVFPRCLCMGHRNTYSAKVWSSRANSFDPGYNVDMTGHGTCVNNIAFICQLMDRTWSKAEVSSVPWDSDF